MSGCSASGICPKCDSNNLMTYTDWKPYDYVSGECLDCGFCYYTQEEQLTLKEVNERRIDQELKPIKKLKEQSSF